MKKQRITIIILAVLAIAAAAIVLSRGSGTIRKELKNFAISDTSNVVKIFFSDKSDNNILLERQIDGSWLVNGEFKARKDMIDLLLATARNLRVAAPVPRAAFNTVVTNLATRSTKVEIYQKQYLIDLFYRIRLFPRVKQTKVYYVGDVTPDNIGTHMILENSTMPFIVYWPGFKGFVASRYSTRLSDWRDHGIFNHKYLQIASVEVYFPDMKEQSYKVVNNKEGFLDLYPYGSSTPLAGYDTLKMLGFIAAFEDIRYEALIYDMDQRIVDSITSSVPQHIITLTDVKGNKVQAKTFRRRPAFYAEYMYGMTFEYDPDRMFALINKGRDFVLVQYFTFNRIIRPLSFFFDGNQSQ